MTKAEFFYNGDIIDVHCDENDIFEKIIIKFSQKIEKKTDGMVFLYKGQFIDKNLTFIELANSIDKERKIMSIVVNDINDKDNSIILKENKELKKKLNESNKTIENLKKEIEELKYQISKIKSEGMIQANSLMEIIKNKDKEINQLKEKQNDINNKKTIYFLYKGKRIFSITCLGTETFYEIEDKFFKEHSEYRHYLPHFEFKGEYINSYQTIDEIGIQNGDIVNLIGLF